MTAAVFVDTQRSRTKGMVLRDLQSIAGLVAAATSERPELAAEIRTIGVTLMFRATAVACLTAKHRSWRAEKEWRLVALLDPVADANLVRKHPPRDASFVEVLLAPNLPRISVGKVIVGAIRFPPVAHYCVA